jgi:protoporphyrinogen IX oxidase
MFLYVEALHIIFIVTWFAGLFYIVRLFVYNTEANDMPEPQKGILQQQYRVMIRRLWLGITWPSAILTLIFGPWMLYMYGHMEPWLWLKLCFVLGLYLYHFSLQKIFSQQMKGIFRYTSQQLRMWNEVATIFLVAIIFLVILKNAVSMLWGLLGLITFVILLMLAIRIYKRIRERGK